MSPNHFCGCERGDDCTRTSMCYVQHVEQDLNDVIETLTTEVSSQHKQIERLEWLLMKEGYVAVRNFSVSGWWC